MSLVFAILCSMIALSSCAALLLKDKLHSVIALSVLSLSLTLAYALLRAPDVAMTEAVVGAGMSTGVLIIGISQTKGARM